MKKQKVSLSKNDQKLLKTWDVNPQEAAVIQTRLSPFIVCNDSYSRIQTIAGVDTASLIGGSVLRAAVCVLNYPDLTLVQNISVYSPAKFPYIPGLLSFREAPAIYNAYHMLANLPDLLFCDGHGLAHPRRFGLACHLGLLFDIPSVGIAKSLLVGNHNPPDEYRGSWQPIIYKEEVIGAALRTQTGVKPVYVSTGHRISLESAIEFTLKCTPKYRLPAPIRHAHHLASNFRVEYI